MLRGGYYARVSSDQQEDNYSIPTQVAANEQKLAALGAEIGDERFRYVETFTGERLDWRVVLQGLLRDVRTGMLDVLVVYDGDRFARDGVDRLLLRRECEKHGCRVVYVLNDPGEGEYAEIIDYVGGWGSKRELAQIKERIGRGKRARLADGKPLLGGYPRFGYDWNDERDGFVIHERTAEIVRYIYSLAALGSAARGIARALNNERVITPSSLYVERHPKTKRHVALTWSDKAVRDIIRDPIYKGQYTAKSFRCHRRPENGKWTTRATDPSERLVLAGVAPAIVEEEIWEAANGHLDRQQVLSPRNSKNPEAFLLRGGYARCGYCGNTATARTTGGGLRYMCNQLNADRHVCPRWSIAAEIIDGQVW
jgi:site-specific DNA recombinase